MPREKFELIDVPEQTVLLMVLLGHARLAEDGIHELTEAGGKWLSDWCDKKFAEHEAAS